jgi:glycosyl hydrolase family 113
MATWRSRALPLRLGIAAIAVAAASLPTLDAAATSTAPQHGFNTYVTDLCESTGAWASLAKGQFTELKALGANSIALAFPLYTNSLTSTSVFARRVCRSNFQTPTAARLEVLVREAHALHLRVLLRPLLDETNLQTQGGWRGSIKPSSVRLWFKSYLATLTPYLKMAQQQKVEYFSIATELDSMAKKSNWAAFIKSAKHDYRGSLSFTINWAETAAGKVAWSGTTPGMDTYQLASLPNSATPSNLLTAWNNALSSSDTVPFSLSSATIDEVAILAQDGAYSEPWVWSLPQQTNPFNESIQANWC